MLIYVVAAVVFVLVTGSAALNRIHTESDRTTRVLTPIIGLSFVLGLALLVLDIGIVIGQKA